MQDYLRLKSCGHLSDARTVEDKIAVSAECHGSVGIVQYGAVDCSSCIAEEIDAVGGYCTIEGIEASAERGAESGRHQECAGLIS